MLFKSQVLTQASGSIGGVTYSHNKGGMYQRARAIPTNPNTSYQQAVRNALAQLVDRWGTLTQAQRNQWGVYAANTPVVNALGDSVTRSGQQMYIRGNTPRIQRSLAIADAGPTTYNLGSFSSVTASASEATQQISVTFNNGDGWANEDDAAMIVRASRPQNVGVNFFKGPYRTAGQIDGDSGTPPTSPAAIAAPFAFVAGDKLFVEVVVSRADGRLSSPFRLALAAAA